MTVNDPTILEEIADLVRRYEDALSANDVAMLDRMFWRSDSVVRFGVGENLYGASEVAEFRRTRSGGSPPRTVLRTEITAFGHDFAVAHVEFRRAGGQAVGRQSQTWARLREGWRIVSAHVSIMGLTS
jgi:hypothetical protein